MKITITAEQFNEHYKWNGGVRHIMCMDGTQISPVEGKTFITLEIPDSQCEQVEKECKNCKMQPGGLIKTENSKCVDCGRLVGGPAPELPEEIEKPWADGYRTVKARNYLLNDDDIANKINAIIRYLKHQCNKQS